MAALRRYEKKSEKTDNSTKLLRACPHHVSCNLPKRRASHRKRKLGMSRLLKKTLEPREMIHIAYERDFLLIDVVLFHNGKGIIRAVNSSVIKIRPIFQIRKSPSETISAKDEHAGTCLDRFCRREALLEVHRVLEKV
jgi:hypothetical protein